MDDGDEWTSACERRLSTTCVVVVLVVVEHSLATFIVLRLGDARDK